MSDKICGVYKITNLVNGKIYIGSSNNINYRWRQHVSKLNAGTHCNSHLQNSWNIYGKDNFKFEVIEKCDESIQFEREQHYLNLYKPFDEVGYNMVRKIASGYSSDNYLEKQCNRCGKSYMTFNTRAKYCEDCKKENSEDFLEKKSSGHCLSAKAEEEGYERYMNRWKNAPYSWWYD